jgi:lactonase
MRADADGNLYVAIYGQGRVLVFNKNGLPIGQILLPGAGGWPQSALHQHGLSAWHE